MDFIDMQYKKKKERMTLVSRNYRWERKVPETWLWKKKTSKRKHRDNAHIKIFNKFRWIVNWCQKCSWYTWWIHIHHIDKNHKNNHPFNLIKLCLECHCKEHQWDAVYALMINKLNFAIKVS